MFVSRWSIRRKLLVCVAIVLAIVTALAYCGLSGGYSYKKLAWTIKVRATDLKLAGELTESLGDLRVSLSQSRELFQIFAPADLNPLVVRDRFFEKVPKVEQDLTQYRRHLEQNTLADVRFGDRSEEQRTIKELDFALARLKKMKTNQDWVFAPAQADLVGEVVDEMYAKATGLQARMHERMRTFVDEARSEYRTWIFLEWTATIGAGIFLFVAMFLFYDWLFQPLEVLLAGSRRIARQDDFDHRIHLKNRDEMAELAAALNDMTARFQQIRSDLDAQVKQRTKEVVRSEQLASVGFLAAGVAHEINNPLASIAWCAESLESRLHDALHGNALDRDAEPIFQPGDLEILQKYLQKIQDEAFRCKGITEKLLDFSRLGDVEMQDADLGQLVQGVIEMVRHLGSYRQKKIEFDCREYVAAPVNSQEIKQVVLNLITNALDSLDTGGVVKVTLAKNGPWAELIVRDNGCGMSEEVLRHLFEPFFTRRRDGSGTGLGLSITYRIVTDHGGTIEPDSAGPGRGATMRVLLPLVAKDKAHERQFEGRREAA